MNSDNKSAVHFAADSGSKGRFMISPDIPKIDEPPPPLSRRHKAWLVFKVIELRLRFVMILVATGLVFGYWDELSNRYEKWNRNRSGISQTITVSDIEFYCPMHPSVVRDKPSNCPICGMPLSQRKTGQKEDLPTGVLTRVKLAPNRIAQAGIRTEPVAFRPLIESLTTVGQIQFDERRLARISSKAKGLSRVEKLYVNFTGDRVEAGKSLADLYSPEIYQAVRELLLAKRTMAERSHLNPSRSNGPDILEIAREKLTLWGVTPAQMDDILTNNRADFKLPLLSPISGIVVRKNVVEGQYVNEGDPIFEVADLRHVWVTAQIFEDQISRVYVGQKVHASVNAIPGKTFEGIVAFIDPALNPETRTVAVRYDLANTSGDLKPGMYATVTVKTPVSETPLFREILAQKNQKIHVVAKPSPTVADQKICPVTKKELGSMGPPINVSLTETRKVWICCNSCEEKLKSNPDKFLGIPEPAPTGTVLTIPESSVIDTGTRKVVYIESEPGVFEGREVILGARSGEFYPVLDGLEPGQRIATAGSFLIDAETRLNPGASGTYFGSTKP